MGGGNPTVAVGLDGYALLFAIPVNRDDFDMAMRGEIYTDYTSELRSGGGGDAAWATGYSRVAAAIDQLISTAEALGVRIYKRATLQDIATATAQSRTVILVAHFRGWPVWPRDFAGHEESVLARFRRGDPLLESRAAGLETLDDVADALNNEILAHRLERFLSAEIRDATRSSALLRLTLQRDLIDEALEGLIAPGNLIELADGLHTPGAVEVAMVPAFRGELDLSMCDSEVLATLMDIRRGGSVRHAYFATEIVPIPHLLTIREALREVAAHGGSYLDTRLRLHQELKKLAAG